MDQVLTILPTLGNFTKGDRLKRENTIPKRLNCHVLISGRIISEIYFDLKHINYGWDAEKRDYNKGLPRNNFTEDDVVSFFEQLNTLVTFPKETSPFLKSVEKRLVFYVFERDIKLRMVVDFMKNQSTVVVTIH